MVKYHEKCIQDNLKLNYKFHYQKKLCDFFLEPTVITRRFVGVLLTFSVFRVEMNRLFGRGTPKAPPPNLSDCVANVDSRAESVDKKIARLDAELRKYKVWAALLWIATPSLTSSHATTMTTTKKQRNYKNNFDDSTTNLSLSSVVFSKCHIL